MFKKRKRKYVRRQVQEEYEGFSISPETKKGIFTVLVFLVALIGVLSIFDLAGLVGRVLNSALSYALGWSDWFFIFIMLLLGYILVKSGRSQIKWYSYFGLFLIIITLTGIFHFFVLDFSFEEITQEAKGGGALGYLVGTLIEKALGFWGGLIFLLAFLFIGLFLSFNTSFRDIIDRAKVLGIIKEKFLPVVDSSEEEDEEEGDSDFEPEEETEEIEEEPLSDEQSVEMSVNKDEEIIDNQEEKPKKKLSAKINIPLDLLTKANSQPDSGDIDANMQKIQKTFENFGIEVAMGDVNVGPTVTQYTLRPAEGVRLSQMLTLQNDLALALAAHPLRMEAPIPGRSLVGIEVPNQTVSVVKLRDVLESQNYRKRKSNLSIALGKNVAGRSILANLPSMPHLLIAGATGSGKSVCVNNIILSLMYQNSPDELKLILIDPKRVELSSFNDIPYLLTPVINETDKTINALRWVVKEMHERYKLLQAAGKRNIDSYNKAVIVNRLPYIVVIVDEFAALMSLAAKEVEAAIVSLAQMARAVGIHLVLATQRPSVNVITGLIKANITSRIAFAVASSMDSRTIIDTSGAEKLLGKGDMLFMTAEESKPVRIQGAYVTDEEISAVVDFVKDKAEPEYNDSVVEKTGSAAVGFSGSEEYEDSLAEEAKEIVLKAGKASATLLQRRLRVGYARAARLLDILEEMGVVSAADGSKPREVLISQDDLEENFSSDLDEEELEDEEVTEDLQDWDKAK